MVNSCDKELRAFFIINLQIYSFSEFNKSFDARSIKEITALQDREGREDEMCLEFCYPQDCLYSFEGSI